MFCFKFEPWSQNFIADTVNQTLLFPPPSLHDWLPEGHLARFLLDVVSAVEMSSDLPPPGALRKEAMRHMLRSEAGRAVYKMRKAIVEPAFGQIKEQRGFRRFSLRGKKNVGREWKPVCAVSNLLKLFRAGGVLEME